MEVRLESEATEELDRALQVVGVDAGLGKREEVRWDERVVEILELELELQERADCGGIGFVVAAVGF